jgi:hypothetical protein
MKKEGVGRMIFAKESNEKITLCKREIPKLEKICLFKNTGTLIDTSKEAGLEVNAEKTKYMLLSCHQNADQNCDIK